MIKTKITPVVVVANAKGGVGKTRTIIELCGMLRDKDILVCDLDPQGNTSNYLLGIGINESLPSDQPTIFNLLVYPKKINFQTLVMSASKAFPNVSVIPSDIELTNATFHLAGEINFETRLINELDRIKSNYDLILVDTGPQLSVLTKIALRAADKLLIPTDTSMDAIKGIHELLEIKKSLEKANHIIDHFFIFRTSVQKDQNKSTKEAIKSLKDTYGENFLSHVDIGHTVKVRDSQWQYNPPIPAARLVAKDHSLSRGYKELSRLIKEKNNDKNRKSIERAAI